MQIYFYVNNFSIILKHLLNLQQLLMAFKPRFSAKNQGQFAFSYQPWKSCPSLGPKGLNPGNCIT